MREGTEMQSFEKNDNAPLLVEGSIHGLEDDNHDSEVEHSNVDSNALVDDWTEGVAHPKSINDSKIQHALEDGDIKMVKTLFFEMINDADVANEDNRGDLFVCSCV